MSKAFWGVIAAILVIFGAVIIVSNHKQTTTTSSGAKPTNHVEGNLSSNVKLVEYGDFQCPFCEAYFPTVQTIYNDYKDKISFQFRNFPLVNNHPNAFAAARAAEAAGLQGKYWEMHDMLYDSANWQAWTPASDPNSYFDSYAQQLGLNVDQFKKDFASSKVNDLITADMNAGNKLNIQGTPTFFLDGKQVQISNTVESFKKVLDAEIANKQPASSTSTAPASSTDQSTSNSSSAY